MCVEYRVASWLASRVAKSSSYFARHWVCSSGAYVIYVAAVLVAKRVPPGSQLSGYTRVYVNTYLTAYGTLQSPSSFLLGGMCAISFSLALGNIFLGSTRLGSSRSTTPRCLLKILEHLTHTLAGKPAPPRSELYLAVSLSRSLPLPFFIISFF